MKASGEYNPVTQSAGGSLDISRTDYSERRKDSLFYLVLILAALILCYVLFKDAILALMNPVKTVTDSVGKALSDAAGAAAGAVKQANQNSIDTVVRAAGAQPGEAATEAYWDAAKRYLGEGAIQSTAISAGNVILSTPVINNLGQPLLAQAAISGQEFRQELDTYGDYERLEADPLKGFIVAGEGLSKTFTGFDPYLAGKAFDGWSQDTFNLKW